MWMNIVLSAAADPTRAKHTAVGGLNNGTADVTFAYDPSKLTSLNAADVILRDVRAWLIGAGLK
jgi:hypothetical protein